MSMNCPRCGRPDSRYNCESCHQEYLSHPLRFELPQVMDPTRKLMSEHRQKPDRSIWLKPPGV